MYENCKYINCANKCDTFSFAPLKPWNGIMSIYFNQKLCFLHISKVKNRNIHKNVDLYNPSFVNKYISVCI